MPRRTLRLPIMAAAIMATAVVAPAAQAAFPGTNGAIAYTHWQDPFASINDPEAVAAVDALEARTIAPGTTAHVRLPDTPDASETSVAYSPDGTQLAWAVIDDGKSKATGIYVGPANGGPGRRIATGTDLSEPSWTAAGDRVAFATTKRGLQTVPVGGGEPTVLIGKRRGWMLSAASFSADGTRMAYSWFRTTKDGIGIRDAEIWTANADGTGARRILGGGKGPLKLVSEPDLSPDGTSLAFATTTTIPFDRTSIYVSAADGSNPRKVATSPRQNLFGDVAWAPDGTQLLTSRIRIDGLDGSSLSVKVSTTLLTIDPATGTQTVRLRVPKAMGFGVAWQPIPVAAP